MIKDYSTKIAVSQTMGEIIGFLTSAKARQVSTLFDEAGQQVPEWQGPLGDVVRRLGIEKIEVF